MQYAEIKNLFKKISIYATGHTEFEIDWKKYLLKKHNFKEDLSDGTITLKFVGHWTWQTYRSWI